MNTRKRWRTAQVIGLAFLVALSTSTAQNIWKAKSDFAMGASLIRSAAAAESSAGQQTPAMADVGAAMPTVLRDRPRTPKAGQPAERPSDAPATLSWSPQAQAPAAVTACTSGSGALINPNFETASGSQAAGWCDVFGRGYTRVRLTPAKYNFLVQHGAQPLAEKAPIVIVGNHDRYLRLAEVHLILCCQTEPFMAWI